jgi:hypothetical protein
LRCSWVAVLGRSAKQDVYLLLKVGDKPCGHGNKCTKESG